MRIVVDFDLCESNAVCMGIAPEVFEVRDDDFLYVLDETPAGGEPPEDGGGGPPLPEAGHLDRGLSGSPPHQLVQSIVVVGASLAGCRAAEALREEGFDGRIVVVGDEPHPPYDRPPLSKQVLAGTWDDRPHRSCRSAGDGPRPRLAARRRGRPGSTSPPAGSPSTTARTSPSTASSSPPARRRARCPSPTGMAGVHTLRTLDDCLALRAELDAQAPAGWWWSAPASSAPRWRPPAGSAGSTVTMVEALPAPLARVLGEVIGGTCADLHRDHGVDVRTGVGVDGLAGGARVEQVRARRRVGRRCRRRGGRASG